MLAWTAVALAQDVVIDDTLRTSSTATTVYGGSFTGAGWRVDDSNSRMYWDLGTQVERGSVTVTIDGMTLENIQGDNNHIIELFDSGGHWSCNRAINVRLYGPADPSSHGDLKLKVWDENGNYAEARSGILDWDGSPHTFTVTWDTTTAVLYRDGAAIVTLDATGIDLRVGTLWLPLNDWVGDYSAPIGSVYSDLRLRAWEPGSGGGGQDTGVPDDGDPNTFSPVQDAGVIESLGGSVYGDVEDLPVEGDGASPIEASYLMFDLSSLSGTVTSATLTLHVRDGGSSGGDGGVVWSVGDVSWDEDTLAWSGRPSTGASLGTYGATSPGDVVTVDVTAGVQAGGPVAFALLSSGGDGTHFASKEDGDGGGAAVLTVVTQPSDGGGGGGSGGGGGDTGGAVGDGDTDEEDGSVDRPLEGGVRQGAAEGGCGCGGGGPVTALGTLLALLGARVRRSAGTGGRGATGR